MEALKFFVEPYLQEELKNLTMGSRPSLDQFINIEIKAYQQVHLKRPGILGSLDFTLVEQRLRKTLADQKDYLPRMRNLYRKTLAMAEYV